MQADKTERSLPGVGCEVTSCTYNGEDRMCHANHIMVEKQSTRCSEETDTFCGTFIAK